MKNQKVSSLAILAVIIVAALVVLQKNKSTKTQSVTGAQNELQTVTVGQISQISNRSQNKKAPEIVEAPNLSACGDFLLGRAYSNLNETLKIIMQQSSQKEVFELTEYQLLGGDNREIIVQHTPDEEPKNKIRVLRVADDGFPDRVKNFDGAKGSTEAQLQGALSLGKLQKKIDKYSVTQGRGIQLKFEKSEGQVVQINYTNGRNQLLCEEAKCSCQSF